MAAQTSIADLLDRVAAGDDRAVNSLWDRYFPDLVRVAEARLRQSPRARRAEDGEDVALSALDSFVRAVKRKKFPELADRDGLWRLLFRMTVRKSVDRVRREGAQVRGGDRLVGESALHAGVGAGDTSVTGGLARAPADDPLPDLAAMMDEECRRLLAALADDEARRIVQLRLEGFTNDEIAASLGCAKRTIERRLDLIRKTWKSELAARPD
jgi:RNA polymerase sigma factor (sigma-70 family)